LQTCVGQPIRECSLSGDSCLTDSECDVGAGETCNVVQLVPPPPPGFPDLVLGTPDPVREYGCVLENLVEYLGAPGACNISGDACQVDADCTMMGDACVLEDEQVRVHQEIFIRDDVRFGRR